MIPNEVEKCTTSVFDSSMYQRMSPYTNSIVRTQSNQGSYFFCTRDYFGVQISR